MEEIIILPIFFACATYLMVSVARVIQRTRRDARMAEITSKLIERLGAGEDVARFISSDAYRNLLAGEPAPEGGVRVRILNSLQAGAVLFAGGAAMLTTANWIHDVDGKTFLGVLGSVLLAVGIALALSAFWSNWLMSRWNTPAER